MFLIDTPTSVGARPAPAAAGAPGWFSEGNPATNTPATVVTGDWLNMMQAEFAGVLAAAGMQPDKTNPHQVAAAIALLVTTSVAAAGGGGAAGSLAEYALYGDLWFEEG